MQCFLTAHCSCESHSTGKSQSWSIEIGPSAHHVTANHQIHSYNLTFIPFFSILCTFLSSPPRTATTWVWVKKYTIYAHLLHIHLTSLIKVGVNHWVLGKHNTTNPYPMEIGTDSKLHPTYWRLYFKSNEFCVDACITKITHRWPGLVYRIMIQM